MSIHLKNAEFNKVEEQPKSKEYDIYTRTIMEAKQIPDDDHSKTQDIQKKLAEAEEEYKMAMKVAARKKKLLYELEMKDQMRKIQKN